MEIDLFNSSITSGKRSERPFANVTALSLNKEMMIDSVRLSGNIEYSCTLIFRTSKGPVKMFEKPTIRKNKVFLEKGVKRVYFNLYFNSKNVRFIIRKNTVKHL